MIINTCVIGHCDKLQGIIIIIIFQIDGGTIRYRLLLTATTHRRITPFSRVALSSYSYSTSSYSFGDDDVDCDDDADADIYDGEVSYGLYEMDVSTTKGRAEWTTDLVQ